MSKIKLTIDNRQVQVDSGSTILDAAQKAEVVIPTMCFKPGFKASTSCMLCVVKVDGREGLVPACGAIAEEGMVVDTLCEQVQKARVTALELLLSDHVGDCMGPCQVGCPATMDIPLMIRQIAAGNLQEAVKTVKKDIALPAILGRICPAPCEKVCRRSVYDDAVSICLLKRYAADRDLEQENPYLPECAASNDKKVAIVGAGPCGLSCAYYLAQAGYNCTIFDEHDKPGGMLRYAVPREKLSEKVLDKEIDLILKLGIEFKGNTRIGAALPVDELANRFNAVFIASGELKPDDAEAFKIQAGPKGIKADRTTYQTSRESVFAGGDATGKRQLAVRAAADGKNAAECIDQYLSGGKTTGLKKPFNSRMGIPLEGEIETFVSGASKHPRNETKNDTGLSDEQALKESLRCLHCDCRKGNNCLLRDYSTEYGARQSKYKSQRRVFVQESSHPDIIFESGKCINCGLCIQTAAARKEELGLTFIGRGFDVRVQVPFNETVAKGLKTAAKECVQICPTGALAFK
jgi:ferredoxin